MPSSTVLRYAASSLTAVPWSVPCWIFAFLSIYWGAWSPIDPVDLDAYISEVRPDIRSCVSSGVAEEIAVRGPITRYRFYQDVVDTCKEANFKSEQLRVVAAHGKSPASAPGADDATASLPSSLELVELRAWESCMESSLREHFIRHVSIELAGFDEYVAQCKAKVTSAPGAANGVRK